MAINNQPGKQEKTNKAGLALQRFFMQTHVALYRRTGGAIGGMLAGRPMLLLMTIGRKSGQERATPISYYPDGDRYILIASNGGAPRHPQWFFNLLANPQAKIQVQKKIIEVTAKQADPEERQRLWSLITEKYQNFADYQERITREIPVVILTPRS